MFPSGGYSAQLALASLASEAEPHNPNLKHQTAPPFCCHSLVSTFRSFSLLPSWALLHCCHDINAIQAAKSWWDSSYAHTGANFSWPFLWESYFPSQVSVTTMFYTEKWSCFLPGRVSFQSSPITDHFFKRPLMVLTDSLFSGWKNNRANQSFIGGNENWDECQMTVSTVTGCCKLI